MCQEAESSSATGEVFVDDYITYDVGSADTGMFKNGCCACRIRKQFQAAVGGKYTVGGLVSLRDMDGITGSDGRATRII